MLWDIIRDFIVQYITGGNASNGEYYSTFLGLGQITDHETYLNEGVELFGDTTPYYKIAIDDASGYDVMISMGDWLATTITIICMILIVVFAIWLVRWIFKAVSSAFLLRR